MIRYGYNTQNQPPAPFVRLTLRHPHTEVEARDVPAQIDTGADQTLAPAALVEQLGLYQSGSEQIATAGGHRIEMNLFDAVIVVHDLPPQRLEVLAHPSEPWVLLGRDVLNSHRLLLDGPNLVLEIG